MLIIIFYLLMLAAKCQGRISDGGVFKNTSFYELLENKKLQIPLADCLEGRQKKVPYVFVADEAFPLKENILKPYSGLQDKGSVQRSFNYRLSRARRIVENVFGIQSAVFRVLKKPMLLEPEIAKLVVLACIYLHNFLRKKESDNAFTHDQEQNGQIIEGSWRQNGENTQSFFPFARLGRRSTKTAEEVRKQICCLIFKQSFTMAR